MFVGDFLDALYKIFFLNAGRWVDNFLCKMSIVGDDQQSGGVAVKAPYCKEARFLAGKQIENDSFTAQSYVGTDETFWLVQEIIDFALFAANFFTINAHIVFFQTDMSLRGQYCFSVDSYPSRK